MTTARKTLPLVHNLRFYILVSSLLVSLALFAWLRISIESDQLFLIRTQQVFGLSGVLLWYTALIISPLSYVISKKRMAHILFARRAIGVSAAYFVLLHGAIALLGQLGGVQQIALLPTLFKWSLLAGAVAGVILLIMAATSFDVVIRRMTYRRWKLLHRLGYIGGLLAIVHIWSIGTHLAYSGVQLAALSALVILSGLESYRVTTVLARRYPELNSKDYFVTLVVAIWALWVVVILAIPGLVRNYHSQHTDHKTSFITEVRS